MPVHSVAVNPHWIYSSLFGSCGHTAQNHREEWSYGSHYHILSTGMRRSHSSLSIDPPTEQKPHHD
eukprot:scaffold23104_cov56-Attheya_sp.AAC.2